MRAIVVLLALCPLIFAFPADAAAGKKPKNPYYGYQSSHLRGGYGAKHAGGQYGSHPKREKPKPAGRSGNGAAGQD